jgi:hypothetical protein
MNEDLKRLIEVLNKAGYAVVGIQDIGTYEGFDEEKKEPCYLSSGYFQIKVARKHRA